MSSTKTNITIGDVPHFNGKNYQQWASRMEMYLLLTNTLAVIDGSTVAITRAAPVEPATLTGTVTATEWAAYTAQFNTWNIKNIAWNSAKKEFNESNVKAKGLFSATLDIGIWDQCKTKMAKEIWDWLKMKYGKEQFVEVLEDF